MRVAGRLAGLRRMIHCVSQAIFPVVQALMVGLIVCFVYATLGVENFGDRDPEGFGTFAKAVYTVFAIVAFQKWRDEALPSFDSEGGMDVGVLAYIYSFVAIVCWVLLQIVVATL